MKSFLLTLFIVLILVPAVGLGTYFFADHFGERILSSGSSVTEETPEIEPEQPAPAQPHQSDTPQAQVEEDTVQDIQPTAVINHDVPFTMQAPFAEWSDPRQQDACEEASLLMAVRWARGETLTLEDAKTEILAVSHFQDDLLGYYRDTGVPEAELVLREYYKDINYTREDALTKQTLMNALYNDSVVVAPADGRALNNPYFTPPGPEHHMLVIRGYDPKTDEFITNDPGVSQGEGYRYPSDTLMQALRDYPSGAEHRSPTEDVRRALIIHSVSQ